MDTNDVLDHLEKLVSFKAVAEKGSIRKASEFLHIAQPSLTVKLQILEEALGLSLFERTRKGVILTTEGQKVLDFTNHIIDSAEVLKIDLEGENILQGHIRIGLYDSIARYFWPGFYKSFSKSNPGISMTILTGRSQFILEQLENNKIDLAITIEPQETYDIDVDNLYSDHFSFYCNRSYGDKNDSLNLKGKTYTLKEGGEEAVSLFLFSQAIAENKKPLERTLKIKQNQQFLIHRVENFEIAHSFCLEGIGLSVLPNRVAQSEYEKERLFKVKVDSAIPLNFAHHEIGLSKLRSKKNKPIIKHVCNVIKSQITK